MARKSKENTTTRRQREIHQTNIAFSRITDSLPKTETTGNPVIDEILKVPRVKDIKYPQAGSYLEQQAINLIVILANNDNRYPFNMVYVRFSNPDTNSSNLQQDQLDTIPVFKMSREETTEGLIIRFERKLNQARDRINKQ